MSILLDTHVWIWLVKGDVTVKPSIRKIIENAYEEGNLAISTISVWEIAMLVSKKKLILSLPTLDWIHRAVRVTRSELIGLSAEVAVESCQLPNEFVGDPADRIIVATARL